MMVLGVNIRNRRLFAAAIIPLLLAGGCVNETATQGVQLTALSPQQTSPDPEVTASTSLPAGRKVALITTVSQDAHVQSLTEAMAESLKAHGYFLVPAPAQVSPNDDLFFVSQEIQTKMADSGEKTIRVSWIVADSTGETLGKVDQKRALDAGMEGGLWTRAATLAAAAAAENVSLIIREQE